MKTTKMADNSKVLAGAFLYAFVLLLVLSPDSYLYDPYERCDTAWFFMAGKAWMNGMEPYVDFADSKGPLLWLIYGCGYLLSPTTYVGVFWISCFFFAATFAFAYKLTRLFADHRAAFVVLALLPWALFCRRLHHEIRAEDFCYPFVMVSLYCAVKACRAGGRSLFAEAFATGVCLMCSLLIKWNAAAMLSGAALVVLVGVVRARRWQDLLGGVLGLAAVALPFAAYFWAQGNFSAFVHEYFCATYSSVVQKPLQVAVWEKLAHPNLRYVVTLGLATVGWVLLVRRHRLSPWLYVVPVPFFSLLLAKGYPYYATIATPLTVGLLIAGADWMLRRFAPSRTLLTAGCALAVAAGTFGNVYKHHPSCFRFLKSDVRQQYLDMEALMARTSHPRVMCLAENGVGITAQALPACKYWALQAGASPEMMAERTTALRQRKADYIILRRPRQADDAEWFSDRLLSQCGYAYCGTTVGEKGCLDQFVFCRRELLPSARQKRIVKDKKP